MLEKLKVHSKTITPSYLFALFEHSVKSFMLYIRDRLVEYIYESKLILQRPPLSRRYSVDDFLMIDKEIHKMYPQQAIQNDFFIHCSQYLTDPLYEKVKADLRYRIWQ